MLQYRIPVEYGMFWQTKRMIDTSGSKDTYWLDVDVLGRPILCFSKITTQEYQEKTKQEVFENLSKAGLLKEQEVLYFIMKSLSFETECFDAVSKIQGISLLQYFYPNTKIPNLKKHLCALVKVSEMDNAIKELKNCPFLEPEIMLTDDFPERELKGFL